MHIDRDIDLKGLNCPLPILRTKKALADMSSGQTLQVWATDPGTPTDFAQFCRQTGHQLLLSEQVDGAFHFVLQRK
ncbi:sulfurtransferase TusA family protein [Leeia aquatica]|uniref:Sulfurtransferase TusA family protein n=1 Tax=Leeia aquatica TaxID=2725557 RepID=A0A847SCS8_9NEIS|nr:sulfurtransferase TusA family protein [Leeia aquatica]NLR74958.1 sulfurtransferase TusA family protein [Leeia aquatica]